ncbi:branched-chain-amino-acid transaminase [Pusillimonas caeni]|uniref:branched-chain-amino-acid transaminase n=1 Tax=Pusillimonas caeni TaxID=1348472 RepID=UPI000E59E153|nr:branched-chain-amino-acid transaminase [Pusillimonas caeni]TFL14118.1 branched-chain-amino-acid transaminase [Pusillimonas caeni]
MTLKQAGTKVWIDGNFVDERDARVDFISNSFQYGFSVFEGIRAYKTDKGPAVFRLKEHIERLFKSAKIIGLKIPYTQGEIIEACLATIRENGFDECYIRPVAYIGSGGMGLSPEGCDVSVGIATWFWGEYLGKGKLEKGTRVATSSFTRHHINSNMSKAKAAGNYMLFQMARVTAHQQGYDEALLLDAQGHVAEGSVENVFIVKDGELITPPLTHILDGITRDTVIKIARENGWAVREEFFTRDYVYVADEMIFVGTGAEVTPVVELDDRPIGDGKPGPLTRKLQQIYFDLVRGNTATHPEWRALVNKSR